MSTTARATRRKPPCAADDARYYLRQLADAIQEQAREARRNGRREFSVTTEAADGMARRIVECVEAFGR